MTTTPTPYGPIFHGGPCDDDYENIVLYDQGGDRAVIKMQRPAIKSFKEAEEAITRKFGRKQFILLTGSWRSCELQRQLFASDPNRFAHPDTTLHTRGLAIDVSQNQSSLKLKRIHTALTNRGWNRVRPDDEPWHYSFHLTA